MALGMLTYAAACLAQTAPQIEAFSAVPQTIVQGGTSTLNWRVSNANFISIDQGIGSVGPTAAAAVAPSVTTTYALTATNGFSSVTARVTVTVQGLPPPIFSVAPAVLLFYDVPMGTTRQLAITISPTAQFDFAITIQPDPGTPGGAFSVQAADKTFVTFQARVVNVSFSPSHAGPFAAALAVSTGSGTKTVILAGGGVADSGMAITGVVNAADHFPAASQDSWMEIHGRNLAPTTRSWNAADFIEGKLPTGLDNVSVDINGAPAYVAYISPTQINILTPPIQGLALDRKLTVSSAARKSNAVAIPWLDSSLSLFVWGSNSKNYILATRPDGSYAGPGGILGPDVSLAPARPGETLALYMSGLGPGDPAFTPGQLGAITLAGLPSFRIGAEQATALYAAMIGPGLYQVGLRVPSLAAGEYGVTCVYNGAATSAPYLLAVVSPNQ